MVLHHSQDVFQIAERIQVIRFRCFCDAVDDRTGFRAVDTVDQLPCMFVQAEAAQRAFRCVIIKRDFTVTKEYFSCLFLVDAVVDPFQGFTFDQTAGFLDLFCPRKESLCQRFEVDLPLFPAVVRFQICKLVVQMIDRFIGDRFFGCLMLLFRQCFQGICEIPSRTGPAPCKDDGFGFPVQLPVGGVSVADNDTGKSFQEFPGIVYFPGLLVFIQDDWGIPISLSCPVDPHVTLTVRRPPIL